METDESQITKSQRVQFTEDTFGTVGHDSDITIRNTNESLIDVHLGFLQVRHRYEITLTFDCPNCIEGPLVVRNQQSSALIVNTHVINLRSLVVDSHMASKSSQTTTQSAIKYEISVELFAHKEKLLKEQICLTSSQNVLQTITMVFHARVLGKGKGTPLLKNGIKCIGIEMDEDEDGDNSDWPGFAN